MYGVFVNVSVCVCLREKERERSTADFISACFGYNKHTLTNLIAFYLLRHITFLWCSSFQRVVC